jgi:hypothetical protein
MSCGHTLDQAWLVTFLPIDAPCSTLSGVHHLHTGRSREREQGEIFLEYQRAVGPVSLTPSPTCLSVTAWQFQRFSFLILQPHPFTSTSNSNFGHRCSRHHYIKTASLDGSDPDNDHTPLGCALSLSSFPFLHLLHTTA